MEAYKEPLTENFIACGNECHCSVCFALINDVDAASHTLAGRYYCKRCRSAFRKEELGAFVNNKS